MIQKAKQPPAVIVGESGVSEAGWHKVAEFLSCPKKYQFAHVRGLSKPINQTPDYFAVGSIIHAGRARWFSLRFATDAKAWASIQAAIVKEVEKQKLPVTLKAEQTAMVYMKEYVDHWSKQVKPTPVAAEYLLGPAPIKKDDPFFLFRTARLDDVSRYPDAGNALCIGECKTTSGSIHDCSEEYKLHGQPMLQAALWKLAPQGEAKFGPIDGVMLDVIKKGYSGERCQFAREFIPITEYSLKWYVDNLREYLRGANNVTWDAKVSRNINSCTSMRGRMRVVCPYRPLCMHGKSASIQYTLPGGESLFSFKPDDERHVMPWE